MNNSEMYEIKECARDIARRVYRYSVVGVAVGVSLWLSCEVQGCYREFENREREKKEPGFHEESVDSLDRAIQ